LDRGLKIFEKLDPLIHSVFLEDVLAHYAPKPNYIGLTNLKLLALAVAEIRKESQKFECSLTREADEMPAVGAERFRAAA